MSVISTFNKIQLQYATDYSWTSQHMLVRTVVLRIDLFSSCNTSLLTTVLSSDFAAEQVFTHVSQIKVTGFQLKWKKALKVTE